MSLHLLRAALLLSLAAPAPDEWQHGYAVRYAPGVMQQVARNRQIPARACMVAWTYATVDDLGVVELDVRGVKTGTTLRCLVVDLPAPSDRQGLVRRGIIVELDYASSRQICGRSWRGAARECKVDVRVSRN